ncbi:hypothetical protein ACOSQ3_001117 [Xanthoceras sorbifolium]
MSMSLTYHQHKMKMGSRDSGGIFVKGSLVEVSSDVDGFRGAWFVAKVLEAPQSSLRRSPRTTSFMVEYQSLLSNDGRELLREYVTFPFLRPLPPPPHEQVHQSFEVSDVVDAYHQDGWWVGVVCEVCEDPKAYTVVFDDPPDLIKFRPSDVRMHLDWVGGKWVQPPKKIMQWKKVGTNSRKRKRGERQKSLLREKALELTDSSSKAKDIEMAFTIVPYNMAEADEPISMCPSTIVADSSICDRTFNCEGEGRIYDIVVQYDAREATVDNMPYKNQSLPLLESSSSVLNFIQSMEVFQSIPQEPHFRPLNECNEICREGLAIGQWITFAKVTEQTSELQVDASRSTFNSMFECLSNLESHGFDVKAVRSRLLELQSMKENQEQLQTKLEKFKCEIVERTNNETKIKVELDDAMGELQVLEEKIKVVGKKKTRLISMMEENDSKIAKLKLSDDLVDEKIRKVKQDFESLSASPW